MFLLKWALASPWRYTWIDYIIIVSKTKMSMLHYPTYVQFDERPDGLLLYPLSIFGRGRRCRLKDTTVTSNAPPSNVFN